MYRSKQRSIDILRLKQAIVESTASKCVKHSVGCIITDQHGRIKGSGYNGTNKGEPNCCDVFPDFVKELDDIEFEISSMGTCNAIQKDLLGRKELIYDEHRRWSADNEVHAEINALIHSNRSDYEGGTMYVTHPPCKRCATAIRASGISRLVYINREMTNQCDPKIFGRIEVCVISYNDVMFIGESN